MKISIFLALALFLLISPFTVSCSQERFADDVACKDIADRCSQALGDGLEYRQFEDAHTRLYFDTDSNCDHHFAIHSEDAQNINELGVFHAKDSESADRLERLCVEYIDGLKRDSRAFIASYAPNELPKLDGAQVRRFGNYVVYTVLPDKGAEDALSTVRDMLKK